jgi:ribonucleoside-diphosphate reductase beta chain
VPGRGGDGTYSPVQRWPSFFSHIVARLQWDANAIDLAPDARAWAELADERRDRLTTLLAGFRVAEDAVAEHLTPFGQAANNSLVAWVLYLQRRDEQRHALIFDRVVHEVMGLDGESPAERRDAARAHAGPVCSSSSTTDSPRCPPSSRRAAPAWTRASGSTTAA